jgi:NAD(P)-dependent dehydrogenase (short-subunit alcohol dehydrogenase family)
MAPSGPGAAIPDLTSWTAVVTGASGGIGLEVARGLAGNGAHVVLGVRSAGRGQSILFAATSPDVQGGDFIGPGGRFGIRGAPGRVRAGDRTRDEDLARRLWQVSEQLTGLRYALPGAQ